LVILGWDGAPWDAGLGGVAGALSGLVRFCPLSADWVICAVMVGYSLFKENAFAPLGRLANAGWACQDKS
jgi:hypothetical protein